MGVSTKVPVIFFLYLVENPSYIIGNLNIHKSEDQS